MDNPGLHVRMIETERFAIFDRDGWNINAWEIHFYMDMCWNYKNKT